MNLTIPITATNIFATPDTITIEIPKQLLERIVARQEKETVEHNSLNREEFDEIIQRTFGILPHLPSGVDYTNRMRKSWDKRNYSEIKNGEKVRVTAIM